MPTLIRQFLPLTLSLLVLVTPLSAQKKGSHSSARPTPPRPSLRPAVGLARLHFCGEMVPTQQSTVSAKLAVALAGSSGYARHVGALKARSAPFFSVIEPILARHNVPNDFKYLPLIESAWQANAVSSAGAVGYWQFMDETAKLMGLSIDPANDERTDLRKSTEAACRYLKDLHRQLGSWTLAAAAYNGGLGMVQRKISKTGHRDYYSMVMNPETGYYLYRILAMKELFTNPAYGVGSIGLLLASTGREYEAEREQARRMGWLQDQEPELVGVPIEASSDRLAPARSEATKMDSVLNELLKSHPNTPAVFAGDVAAKLLQAGQPKIGQSWRFALTEPLLAGEDELRPGDVLYAVVDDIDSRGTLFFRATKAVSVETKSIIPLTLIAIDPATGLAGVPRPKTVKPGWLVQWKL
ncbi:lytic transglycosylase domain-containing protein [uncultured Spirosoma sp.]|uniref:lytic transglycosylase domain-containing protein n=1 Tax=uncultured Spirosoma sp. TaxID=278208 RepID=UPI0025839974|nr:lytic transglycosylase domain-containing protein [uncultured Spirosoma sp.]